MHEPQTHPVYTFGGFELDPRLRLLRAVPGGSRVALSSKAFDTLLYLLEHPAEVVTKAASLRAIWPDVVVEENSLNQAISALRRTLGDTRGDPRYIATVPGRGYQFLAEVGVVERTDKQPGANAAARGSGTDQHEAIEAPAGCPFLHGFRRGAPGIRRRG